MIQLPTIVTKDGFTVTKHFSLPDPVENRAALMIKEAARRTVDQAGDATTATCVLAEAIISGGMKLIEGGANSQELKKGIDKGVEEVVIELKKISISVNDNDQIFHVASVSANNDESIGRLIADAFKKIGDDGVISIVPSKSLQTEIIISEGYKYKGGWVSNVFVNNQAKGTCEFENPLILVYQHRINHHTQLERPLTLAMSAGRPVLIICEMVEQEALGFLALNVYQNRLRCCVVPCPSFGDQRREEMEDIALLTGGTYISDNRGVGIKEMEFENLGTAKRVVISKEETVIVEGGYDSQRPEISEMAKEKLVDLVNDLKMNLTQAKNEEEKDPIEKRIARLTGGIAVIHVGAPTETEQNEKMDRCDDAVRSTKAAIQEGYVAGGGTAFVRVANKIKIDFDKLTDFEKGRNLVSESILKPIKQMAENAGVEPDAILCRVGNERGNFGYNTLTGEIEDLVVSGIIDSTKALRCALVNAASIAGMILTSECLIETIF
jgi:chaperonin GroEL